MHDVHHRTPLMAHINNFRPTLVPALSPPFPPVSVLPIPLSVLSYIINIPIGRVVCIFTPAQILESPF